MKKLLSGDTIYCPIYDFAKHLRKKNAQSEYYLTDVFKMAISDKMDIGSVSAENAKEVMGVNTLEDLKKLEVS